MICKGWYYYSRPTPIVFICYLFHTFSSVICLNNIFNDYLMFVFVSQYYRPSCLNFFFHFNVYLLFAIAMLLYSFWPTGVNLSLKRDQSDVVCIFTWALFVRRDNWFELVCSQPVVQGRVSYSFDLSIHFSEHVESCGHILWSEGYLLSNFSLNKLKNKIILNINNFSG